MRRGGRSGSHRLRSSPAQLAQALKVLNLYFDNNDIEQQRHRETGITKTGNNMELKDIAISKLRLRKIWKPISQKSTKRISSDFGKPVFARNRKSCKLLDCVRIVGNRENKKSESRNRNHKIWITRKVISQNRRNEFREISGNRFLRETGNVANCSIL